MAQVQCPFPISRTIGPLTFYVMHGKNFVRKKSSLSGRRVKTSARFENTRRNASVLKEASGIASIVYRGLPEWFRKYWMFRAFTGEAIKMLKTGKLKEEVLQTLWVVYVRKHESRESSGVSSEGLVVSEKKAVRLSLACPELVEGSKPGIIKRSYRKQNIAYWKNKTVKADKRKSQKVKLGHYALLMGKASRIGSTVYKGLPNKYRQQWRYRLFTGQALKCLKEGFSEEETTKLFDQSVRQLMDSIQGTRDKEIFSRSLTFSRSLWRRAS